MEVAGAEFSKAGATRKILKTVLAPPAPERAKGPELKTAASAPTVALCSEHGNPDSRGHENGKPAQRRLCSQRPAAREKGKERRGEGT